MICLGNRRTIVNNGVKQKMKGNPRRKIGIFLRHEFCYENLTAPDVLSVLDTVMADHPCTPAWFKRRLIFPNPPARWENGLLPIYARLFFCLEEAAEEEPEEEPEEGAEEQSENR